MTPQNIRNEIDSLTFAMLEAGLAISYNPTLLHTNQSFSRVTWSMSDSGAVLWNIPFASILEYRRLIEDKMFSILLSDGSVFQISYVFERGNVVKHSLGFYPCPYDLTDYDSNQFELIDYIDNQDIDAMVFNIRLRSPLRFDYDIATAGINHPASHIHISHPECRIPVYGPISVGHFIKFVYKNFFPIFGTNINFWTHGGPYILHEVYRTSIEEKCTSSAWI